jgi:signal transduction histidine kinase/CheY-like chemotaxis protein
MKRGLAVSLIAIWTAGIALSWGSHWLHSRKNTLELARIEARTALSKDILYRRWNTMHGGVYVPASDDTPPNPHLGHVPERDVKTPSGRTLTLVNPAYMTRQAHEMALREEGTLGHITSLRPIRAGNRPDQWESEALRAFERGEKEAAATESRGGREYMRLMRPFVTETGCLKCHAAQGYKEGDIRGGISVAVPMAPVRAVQARDRVKNSLSHLAIWAAGLAGIVWGTWRYARLARERRSAMEELRRHRDNLEALVLERTEALRENEQKLVQAQKMEAVGQLAGGVAHDFNNILSVIGSYTGFVMDELPADSRTRADAMEIKKAADRAAALTRQLLAFSRKQVIEPREIAVNEAIGNMNKMLCRLISEHISLELKLAADAGSILMDQGQLDQILINLSVNARDAMPGGGRLTIETGNATLGEDYVKTRPGMAPGEHVVVTISDTGTGIPREIQHKVFDPFFTTKEKGKGTGLGLAMVYGAMKQNGGDVHLYSEPGRGTVFKLYFPRVASASAPMNAAAAVPLKGSGERILVVEDDEAVRRAAVRILGDAGYSVAQAAAAEAALALIGEGRGFDLILTDVIMPGMGGAELGRRLAASHPHLPVLYASGYTDDMLGTQGVLKPGVNIVVKPFERETLLRKIRESLDAKA